jgi:hypothetical protein
MTLSEQILARVAALFEWDAKDEPDIAPGSVRAVPGKGLWKAKNRKGTVKVFTNTQDATAFANAN